ASAGSDGSPLRGAPSGFEHPSSLDEPSARPARPCLRHHRTTSTGPRPHLPSLLRYVTSAGGRTPRGGGCASGYRAGPARPTSRSLLRLVAYAATYPHESHQHSREHRTHEPLRPAG